MSSKIRIYLVPLVCIYLFVGSCTQDYFVSESNVRLYVPQLASGEIQTLTMVIHGENDEFLLRTTVTTDDVQLIPGKLIRLPVIVETLNGSEITITCVSDLDKDIISDGTDFDASRITSSSTSDNVNRFFPSADYRFFSYKMMAFPLGVSSKIETLDITKEYEHKGKIEVVFKSLPSEIKSARVKFYGLGSALDFKGEYRGDTSHYTKLEPRFSENSAPYAIDGFFLPSRGSEVANNTFSATLNSRSLSDSTHLDLHVEFLDTDGGILGTYILSKDTEAPTITNSDNTATLNAREMILKSQGKLKFEFEGFTLFKFTLEGWDGDATGGGTTPM